MKKTLFRLGAPALVALVSLPLAAQERPSDSEHRDQQQQDRDHQQQDRDHRDRRDPASSIQRSDNLEIHIAHSAPPARRRERRTARPDADSIWVGGAWDWQGSQWSWTPGRWERPQERGARWIAPRYQRESGAYRYEPGHWSNQQVVEGTEYQQWKQEHGRNQKDRNKDNRDHDHDHAN